LKKETAIVGQRIPRPDTPAKTMGMAEYAADIKLPGLLVGRILRSPYPHANIKSIDTSKAKQLPGVAAVITFADVPQTLFNRSSMAEAFPPPILAGEVQDEYVLSDKARFVGDWIAAAAATDIYTAEKALDLIDVEYEVLPAVFDPVAAMQPGAPVIHAGKERNIAATMEYPFNCGDVEKGFKEADYIVEGFFSTSSQKMCQLEPDAAVACWYPGGRVTVWSPNENPHLAKRVFAKVLNIPDGLVRWITPAVGGGFGGRLSFGVEFICAALAKATGKPVRVECTREEDFIGHDSRTAEYQTMKMGVKKDGVITAIEHRIISDSGAYYSHSGSTTGVNLIHTLGLLRCANIYGIAQIVYTNTPVGGGFRGYGNPEGAFAIQQLIDEAAEKIGMDPLEFRLKNAREAGEPSCWAPIALESCNLEQCIRLGAERIGWREKRGLKKKGQVRRGLGMSIMTHASGAGGFLLEHSNAIIKLNEDGSANLIVSPCEMGQGILGALSQIAAEALGLRYEDIHVVTGDTDVTLFDIGSHASRSVYVIGNAVVEAARDVKRQVLERAAKKLAVSVNELDIQAARVFVKADAEKWVSVSEIAREAIYNFTLTGAHISAIGSFQSDNWCPNFQAAFAEVEVNMETGEVKVIKFVVAHDIGRAINPLNVEGQIEGGVVQGIGFALYEDFVVDKNTGNTITDSFANYKIPSILDIPEIEVILVEEPVPSGPFGAKGVGESGLVNIAPAIANAIYDAVGVRICSLPMTPEKILMALNA